MTAGASCCQRPVLSQRSSARNSPSAIGVTYMTRKPGFITCKADTTTPRLAASSPPMSTSPPVRGLLGIMRMRIVGITRLSDLIVQETSGILFSTLYHYA